MLFLIMKTDWIETSVDVAPDQSADVAPVINNNKQNGFKYSDAFCNDWIPISLYGG